MTDDDLNVCFQNVKWDVGIDEAKICGQRVSLKTAWIKSVAKQTRLANVNTAVDTMPMTREPMTGGDQSSQPAGTDLIAATSPMIKHRGFGKSHGQPAAKFPLEYDARVAEVSAGKSEISHELISDILNEVPWPL